MGNFLFYLFNARINHFLCIVCSHSKHEYSTTWMIILLYTFIAETHTNAYKSLRIKYITASHFPWSFSIFTDTWIIRVIKIKAKQHAVFIPEFGQIEYYHHSNTNKIYWEIWFCEISNSLSVMEFHRIPWTFLQKKINSLEFHGTREHGKRSMEFHETLNL